MKRTVDFGETRAANSSAAYTFEALEGRVLFSLTTPDPTFAGGKGVPLTANPYGVNPIVVLPNHQVLALGGYSVKGLRGRVLVGFGFAAYDSAGRKLYDRRVQIGSVPTGSLPAQATTADLAPDGKLVLGGYLDNGSRTTTDQPVIVVRVNADGTPDNTFTPPLLQILGRQSGFGPVAVQADGKVIVGHSNAASYELDRYNRDGSPDLTFGTRGVVSGSFPGIVYLFSVRSLLVLPDGKILLGGNAVGQRGYYFAAARFAPDGSLDASFGTEGRVLTAVGGTTDLASIHRERNGRFYAVGTTQDADQVRRTVIVRYRASGGLDRTFGTDGKRYGSDTPDTYFTSATLGDDLKLYEVVGGRLVRLMGLDSRPAGAAWEDSPPADSAASLFGTTGIKEQDLFDEA